LNILSTGLGGGAD